MNENFNEIDLRRVDLNLLLVFSALMREGSVSKAAQRLGLGPSAVSMALSRLRETLNDDLFVRSGSGMEPTPHGLRFWNEIAPALSAIDGAVRHGRTFDPSTTQATVRFAVPDDIEFVLVPRLLAKLNQVAPGLRLVFRPSDFVSVPDRLDTGDADIALGATPGRGLERRHRVHALYRDTFSAVYDPAQMGTSGPLDLARYLATPQLLLSVSGDGRGPIDDALSQLGHRRRIAATVAHFATMPHILKRRGWLTNMPTVAARHVAATFDLRWEPLPFEGPDFEVSLCWHARHETDPSHIWFRELVAGLVTELRQPDSVDPV